MQSVRGGGLEPPWVSPYAPQKYASDGKRNLLSTWAYLAHFQAMDGLGPGARFVLVDFHG